MSKALLTGLFLLAAGGAMARDIPVPMEQGYDLTTLGDKVEIARIFQARDGHLIIKFDYHDHGVFKTDYYDTKIHKPLYPVQAFQIARDNALDRKLEADLTPVDDKIGGTYGGGTICPQTPYAITTQIGDFDYLLVKKLPSPKAITLGPDCDVQALTLRYENPVGFLFGETDKGTWIRPAGTAYLVWVTWQGYSAFLRHSDLVLVPYEQFEKTLYKETIVNGVHSFATLSQSQIASAEALIDHYAARQRGNKK